MLGKLKGVLRVDIADESGVRRIDVTLEPNAVLSPSELASRLLANGFRLARLHPEQVSLETAFMRLTKGIVS